MHVSDIQVCAETHLFMKKRASWLLFPQVAIGKGQLLFTLSLSVIYLGIEGHLAVGVVAWGG